MVGGEQRRNCVRPTPPNTLLQLKISLLFSSSLFPSSKPKTSSYQPKHILRLGGTGKFPPPLMRFRRSNAGSRSRRSTSGQAQCSSGKRKTAPPSKPKSQEPSSPKGTCTGQVRVKRGSNKANTKRNSTQLALLPPKAHQAQTRVQVQFPHRDEKSESVFQERVNGDKDSDFASNSSTPPRNNSELLSNIKPNMQNLSKINSESRIKSQT